MPADHRAQFSASAASRNEVSAAAVPRGTMWAAAACGVQVGAAMAASRLVVAELPALTFAGLRYAVAGLLLALVLGVVRAGKGRQTETESTRHLSWPLTTALAIGQFAAVVALINYGLRFIDSATGALVFNLMPLFAMATAVLVGQERLSGRRVAGALLALAGVAVCVGPGAGTHSSSFLAGVGLVLLSAACGAIASVLSRPHLQGVAPLSFAVRAFMVATAALALGSAALEQPWAALAALPALSWLIVAGIGASSALAYWCWLYALKHDKASRVTVFQALGPPSAALCGAWWLGEPLTTSLALAMVLIACGLALATR